jgi:hypothetical protein
VWLAHDKVSALLPVDPGARAGIIATYAKHFAGQPVFIVGDKPEVPRGIDVATLQPVMSRHVDLPMWDESDAVRPSGSHQVPVDIAVWRVRGT